MLILIVVIVVIGALNSGLTKAEITSNAVNAIFGGAIGIACILCVCLLWQARSHFKK